MRKQRGFSIIMAIFILLVLGLLAGYMVSLSGVQHYTVMLSIQGARAIQAARAGIEWSVARIADQGGSCADVTGASPLTFNGMNGFSVKLSCTPYGPFTLGADNVTVYQVRALAEYGSYNNADYVSRAIEVSISN